jgi:hypothetical protein
MMDQGEQKVNAASVIDTKSYNVAQVSREKCAECLVPFASPNRVRPDACICHQHRAAAGIDLSIKAKA